MDDEGYESEDVGGSERCSSEVSVPPVCSLILSIPLEYRAISMLACLSPGLKILSHEACQIYGWARQECRPVS